MNNKALAMKGLRSQHAEVSLVLQPGDLRSRVSAGSETRAEQCTSLSTGRPRWSDSSLSLHPSAFGIMPSSFSLWHNAFILQPLA